MRPKGFHHSEETRRKISIANKGRVFTKEWIKNLSIAHKGQVSWRKGKKFVDEIISKEKRKKYVKKWRYENRERLLKWNREFYKRNAKKMRVRSRSFYRNNKQKELDRMRYKKYGITGNEFREIVEKQNNKCPICIRVINKNFSVDHDHKIGKIRGIICNDCNLAIGNAGSSPERLKSMANYLENYAAN